MVKLGRYAAASAVAAMSVVYYAFHSREQFYPAMLYLATSKISLVLLLNMAFVFLCSIWQLVKLIFLGNLREVEVERLNEQSWREVMEILFAMTIFREEFNLSFVGMVTILLFIKAFHWLAQKRVEYIETTPTVSFLSHARIVSFMLLLFAIDSFFLHSHISHVLKIRRPSVALFFAFEYVILATSTVSMFFKYVLYMRDMMMEGRWENKAVYVFYLELVRDLLHLSLYLVFFLVIFINYGLPLHLVRELYETFRNFKARVTDFVRYKRVTSNMNERFPDATEEELGRSDATCIICREEMLAAKKLPCGHLFHVHCLRSWLERQQTCPTCRSPVLVPEGGAVASTNDVAGNAAQQHPENQPLQEGQGTAILEAPGKHQGSQSNNTNLACNHHQARMHAVAAAAAQYGSSFAYPAMVPGNTNGYLTYVPAFPQQHMFSVLQPRTSPESQQNIPQGPGGSNVNKDATHVEANSSTGAANVHTPVAMAYIGQGGLAMPAIYSTYLPYGVYPVASFSRLSSNSKQSMDGESSSRISGNTDTVQSPSSWLEFQQLQVKHRIELLQKEIELAMNLQSQLESTRRQLVTDPQSSVIDPSQSQESTQTFSKASAMVERKGKAPEVLNESNEGASSSSSSG